MLGIGPSNMLDNTEKGIEKTVELGTKGKPRKLLGMELEWSNDGISVIQTQRNLMDTMAKIHEHALIGVKSSLPVNAEHFKESEDQCDKTLFQSIVGTLLFLARMTRPEISIHVNLLGRVTSKPTKQHLLMAYRVLKYLSLTSDQGIRLGKSGNLKVEIFVDASYGGDKARSQTEALMTLGHQPVG